MFHRTTAAVFTALLTLFASSVQANGLHVEDAQVRQPPPGAQVTAGFMVLHNDSDKVIDITAISSPNFGRVEMHRTVVTNGVARMMPQMKFQVPAGGELVLKHGSWHLMMFKPQQALNPGDDIQFEAKTSVGPLSFTAPVRAPGEMKHSHKHGTGAASE